MKKNNQLPKLDNIPRKSLNLPLANTGLSNGHKKLIRDNEMLLNRLEQLQGGPFGIKNLFRRG